MDEPEPRAIFTWMEFRKWRMLQIAALLPLIVIAALMIYYKTAPGLGVLAFFLVLIVGVLLPQLKADSILSHLILKQEILEEVQRMIRDQMEERAKK